ncbi:MAG: DUF5989 family protein [Pseudomonadota bacterium]
MNDIVQEPGPRDEGTRESPEPSHVEAFRAAVQKDPSGVVGELWSFIRHEKKWWMIPLVAILLLLVALAILGGSPAAPLIYTLF